MWLNLEPDTVALIIPMMLAAQVTAILNQRRCPPLALIHPDTPDHRIVLAGSRMGWACPGRRECTGPLGLCRCRPP
ncbi:MAG: hypothetical protein ACRDUV_01205 [Pseudonocardiaceae bacterium]